MMTKYHLVRIALFSTLFILLSQFSFAQPESPDSVVYDIIYLEKGGGIKGELIAFDEINGGVVFKDLQGRTYSLAREEYKYFIEDKAFTVKKKKEFVIKPRKENELEISLGFSAGFVNMNQNFTADEYYLNGVDALAEIPLSLKLGIGKYLNRQNFIGLTAEIAAATANGSQYFNGGLRYLYQYDAQKRNVALYVPVELKYSNMTFSSNYQVNDTVFTTGGFNFPADQDLETNLQSFNVSIGQGFSFIMNKKKSISVEISFIKYFIISNTVNDISNAPPNSNWGLSELRLALSYNI